MKSAANPSASSNTKAAVMHTLKPGDFLDSRYRLEAFIGQGGFAEVWKVVDTKVNTTHALKVFAPDQKMSDSGIDLFTRDYRLTANLRHNSLLTPTHYSVHEGSPFLIMPLCERGSLDGKLTESGPLPDQEIAKILEQVSAGLEYMHGLSPAILHRDIKTENVLIDDHGNYVITDFGISSDTQQTLQKVTRTQQAISVSYAPPERFESPPKSLPAGDVFSLGVMLFELCTGMLPWDGHGGLLLNKGAVLPNIPQHYPKRLNAIIQACMNPDHQLRPTASELHKWASYCLKEHIWPEMPQKYLKAISANKPSASGRKTQMMGEVAPPDTSGFVQQGNQGGNAPIAGQPAPQDQSAPPSRNKDTASKAGRKMGLLAVIIVLAIAGFFGYQSYFNTHKKRPDITDISEVEDKEDKNMTELLEEAQKEREATPPTPPKTESAVVKKPVNQNTSDRGATYTPPASQGRKYKKIGNIKGVLAELAKGDLPYSEKQKLKAELISFFTDPNRAVVVTAVQGTPTDAESAAVFSQRIITLPNPKVEITNMEKSGNKISKLVVEID